MKELLSILERNQLASIVHATRVAFSSNDGMQNRRKSRYLLDKASWKASHHFHNTTQTILSNHLLVHCEVSKVTAATIESLQSLP
jgi:hypothetical protein